MNSELETANCGLHQVSRPFFASENFIEKYFFDFPKENDIERIFCFFCWFSSVSMVFVVSARVASGKSRTRGSSVKPVCVGCVCPRKSAGRQMDVFSQLICASRCKEVMDTLGFGRV